MTEQQNFSFKKYAWRQFKKNKSSLWSLRILIVFIALAVFAPFIANEQPLYVKWEGQHFFPAFKTLRSKSISDSVVIQSTQITHFFYYDQIDWRTVPSSIKIFPLIAYSSDFNDTYNRDYIGPWHPQRYKSPTGQISPLPWYIKHWMGTDKIGRDVAAGIIYGTKISMLIGFSAVLLSGTIGILLGSIAGFFGDDRIKITRIHFYLGILLFAVSIFITFIANGYQISEQFEQGNTLLAILILFFYCVCVGLSIFFSKYMAKLFSVIPFLNQPKYLKLDAWISRCIEILNSLPTLILIITVAAVLNERSLVALVLIIGLTSWTGIARFMRAEMLRIRNLEYIQSATLMGFSKSRILFIHALPNGIAPVFVSVAFGIAGAILVESGLSFLGIGVPDDVATWGSLLSLGREEFEAGWLVIFPGLAIFTAITIFNLIGEGLRDALDPRLKNEQ